MVRVCNLCLEKLAKVDDDDDDDRRSFVSSVTSFPAHQLGVSGNESPGYPHTYSSSFALGNHHPQSPFAASQLFGRTDEPFNLYSIAETKRLSSSDSVPQTPPLDLREMANGMWEPVRDNSAPFRRAPADDEKDAGTLATPFTDQTEADAAVPPITPPTEFPIPAATGQTSTIQFPMGSPERGLDSPRPHSPMRSRINSYGEFDGSTPFIRSRAHSRLNIIEPGWRTRRESTAYAQELNLTSMLHLKIMLRQMLTKEEIPGIKTWEDTLLKLALRIASELTFTSLPQRQGLEMDVRRYVKIKKLPGGLPSDSEYVDGAVITKNVAHKSMTRTQPRNPRVMLVAFPLEFSRVEGQYLHFGQIMRQEKEYLGNLTSRIAALRPHVVLVEKSVSRLALDALVRHGIAVARTVKPEAIHFVSRMTQGDIFSSIDKLALEPRLGHCAGFRVQTFDHPLIPGRRKTLMRFEGCSPDAGCTIVLRGADIDTLRKLKRVMRFLTFLVRNLKLETHLWKDSVITLPEFNTEAIPPSILPSSEDHANEQSPEPSKQVSPRPPFLTVSVASLLINPSSLQTPRLTTATAELGQAEDSSSDNPETQSSEDSEEDPHDEDAAMRRLSRRIDESLEPYRTTFISVSATLRFPPPYPIRRMKELDVKLHEAKRAWEDEIVRREERGHQALTPQTGSGVTSATITTATTPAASAGPSAGSGHKSEATITQETVDLEDAVHHATELDLQAVGNSVDPQDDLRAQIEALPGLNVSETPGDEGLLQPPSKPDDGGYFGFAPISAGAPPGVPFSVVTTPLIEVSMQPSEPMKTAADIALQSEYSLVKWQHSEQRRIWEWYLRKNRDDFVAEKYQCISLWEYTVPTAEVGLHRACFAPRLSYITFYGENDCTLARFIDKAVSDTLVQFLDPKAVCTGKGCDQPLARHCQVYVHNETRLSVAVEQWDGQIIGRHYSPAPELITTWSACRVCGSATPFIPVSEEMQHYSFAKFLELHFYPADVKIVQGAGCQHNIYQHHVRFFATKGMTVRFQADPVVLHEIAYPPMRIRVRPEAQLEMKNRDFERLHRRNIVWYSGLIDDLRLISIEGATGDEEADAKLLAEVNTLIPRAEAERDEVAHLINNIYRESAPTDTLALNQVHSFRQDKIVAWQQDFDQLPKPRPIQPFNLVDRSTTEKGVAKMTSSAFGTMRAAMWPKKDMPPGFYHPHAASSSVSEAEDFSSKLTLGGRRIISDAFTSSTSEASEAEPDPVANESGKESESAKEESAKVDEDSDVPSTALPPPVSLARCDGAHAAKESTTAESKSGSDSDSTIGAAKDDAVPPEAPVFSAPPPAQTKPETASPTTRLSRLPRRSANQPNVADLVRKYSDYLPAQGVKELAKTAFAPRILVSESEQEYPPAVSIQRSTFRSRSSHRAPAKRGSVSDFEQGYTANVAPVYLTHSRRALGAAPHNSRIPGPVVSTFEPNSESNDPPSQQSSDKRSVSGRVRFSRPSRSPPNGRINATPGPSKLGKGKPSSRTPAREKVAARPPSSASVRSTFRRPAGTPGGRVSNITKHFEKLGRDAERAKSRYTVIRGRRARPVASARAKVEVLDSIKDAVRDETESSASSSEADDEGEGDDQRDLEPPAQSSPEISAPPPPIIDPSPQTAPLLASFPENQLPSEEQTDQSTQPPPGPISLPPSPFLTSFKRRNISATPPPGDFDLGPAAGTAGNSIMRAISYFLPPPPTARQPENDDLMSDPEHIFRDSSMVVRSDEPTSIIALALNSPQYREMLAKSRAEKRTAQQARLTDGGEAFMPDDRSVAESTSTWGVVNVDIDDSADPTEDLRVPSSKLPWAITFESGGLTISCTVLYPEQFDALRRTYDCEKSIVESLARCVKWNADGGKSGSAFLKTRDDRFIAKEISRAELQTMETFAPAYFDYMSSAVSENRPTLLAKVFGCYKLTFKKKAVDQTPGRSKTMQMNLLVMENLFYDRRFSKIYDLKGSTRNRHVQSTGRENEVLLDENLVQSARPSLFP
ncbi:hypothetical protein HGRIS_008461 [Hohenbuehelia grisea]|uniref:1-phosphatidylinositol-3-phosphate 5-kinase n=1 Tax=Hohenbuehelia grisea TaxID=104357 RepID=A0ABR3J824_9AGAR